MSGDVLVVGGGPAGCAAARLLAQWGHAVRLITKPLPDKSGLAESLPPSCYKLFNLLGIRDDIESAGFIRSTGNTVWWGSDERRVEPFASGGHGWQVAPDDLTAILRRAAQAAGAELEERRVTADEVTASAARVVLDATGRAGVVATARQWRVHEATLRTVALVGSWRRSGAWRMPDQTHTAIESYADGWAWSVPLAAGRRSIAVMVDPRTTDLTKAQPARAVYLAELAKTRAFRSLIAGAALEAGPRGFDASMYSSSTYAGDGVLLVGDAASFIDPLSSAGVQKALASGWLAAVAAHTALITPAMRSAAFEFFAAREREMYASVRRLTQRFLSDAASGSPHAFWADRTALDRPRHDAPTRESLRSDPAVRAAFERLRAAPAIAIRPASHVRFEARPAVSGREIVLEQRVVAPKYPSGIRYLCDVDLVAMLELAGSCRDPGELFEAYRQRQGPVALPDFLLALAGALAEGWLIAG